MTSDIKQELLPAASFLDDLARRGIAISLEGERLKISGNKGSLSAEIMNGIKERKEEIVSFIRASEREKTITPIEDQDHYPLSHAQKRLWVISQFPGVGAAYNLPQALAIKGAVQPELFRRSIMQVVEKHESLRTLFLMQEDGPRQRVLSPKDCGFAVQYHDLSGLEEPGEEASRIMEDCILSPFNLSEGPLLRVCLLKTAEEEFILALSMHHIISDGWSMEVFTRELVTAYTQLQENLQFRLEPLAIQYRDFTAWQNTKLQQGDTSVFKDYWMKQLGGDLPVIDLAWEKQRPAVKTYNGATGACRIPATVAAELKKLAEDNGATMFMVTLAALNILLARYTGKYDVIIGTPAAGRDEAALEPQIGFYVNTLPVRTVFRPSDSFLQVLAAVKRSALGAFGHQLYPFDKLVDDLSLERKVNHSPVFDIMVSFLDEKGFGTGEGHAKDASLEAEGVAFSRGISQFDLSVFFYHEQDFLAARFEYNTDILTEAQVSRLSAHLLQLLRIIPANTNTELCRLPLFGEEDTAWFTGAEITHTHTLTAALKKSALQHAERTAFSAKSSNTTYATFIQNAESLASYLLQHCGLEKGQRVALCMEPGAAFVTAFTGIMMAGGVCVPVPVDGDAAHLQNMPDKNDCALIVYNNTLPVETGMAATIDVQEAFAFPAAGPLPETSLHDVVCCIGHPAALPGGFAITQEMILDAAASLQQESGTTATCRVLAGALMNDVAAVQYTLAALLQGATLVCPLGEHEAVNILPALVQQQVNRLMITPPLLQAIMAAIKTNNQLPPFMQVLTDAQQLHPALVEEFYKTFPSAALIAVDVTPARGIAAIRQVTQTGWQPGLLGNPVCNNAVAVLDAQGNTLPAGATGELHIRQAAVNKQPQTISPATATGWQARWHTNGRVECLGRSVRNIKINGNSISLPVIAAAVMQLPGVTHSLVKVHETGRQKQLVLYYTGTAQPAQLAAALAARLPYYLAPRIMMRLDAFPLTASGAIDNQALPEPVAAALVVHEAPASDTELAVQHIWQQVLKHDRFTVTDNFFTAGGHSLRAFQVLGRVNEHFRVRITLNEFFNHATVQALSALVDRALKTEDTNEVQPLEEQAYYLADNRQMKMFARLQFAAQPLPYNIARSFTLTGVQQPAFEQAVYRLLHRHEALRTSFHLIGEQLYQSVHATGTLALPVHHFDLRGETDDQQAAEEIFNRYRDYPFSLEEAPLWRVALVRMKEDIDLVIITMQHIISDGPSLQMLVDDFNSLYEQAEQGLPVQLPNRVQLKEYCAWQNERLVEKGDSLLAYWKQKITPSLLNKPVFAGADPVTESYREMLDKEISAYCIPLTHDQRNFIYGKIATAKPLTGAGYCTLLPPENWQQLCALAASLNCGYFSLLTAALAVWVYCLTGNTGILAGAPVSYRFDERWQNIVGYLVEVLPLPLTVNPEQDFRAAVQAAATTAEESQQHIYPFEQLLDKLDHSIYQAGNLLLHLRSIDLTKDIEYPEHLLHKHGTYAAPQFRLNLKFDLHRNGLVAYCEYWPGDVTAEQAEFFAEGYVQQLQELLQHPGRNIKEYDRVKAPLF